MVSCVYRGDGREVRGVEKRSGRVHLRRLRCAGRSVIDGTRGRLHKLANRWARHEPDAACGHARIARAVAPWTGPPSSAWAPRTGEAHKPGRGMNGAPSATVAAGGATVRPSMTVKKHRRSMRRLRSAPATSASCACSASISGLALQLNQNLAGEVRVVKGFREKDASTGSDTIVGRRRLVLSREHGAQVGPRGYNV